MIDVLSVVIRLVICGSLFVKILVGVSRRPMGLGLAKILLGHFIEVFVFIGIALGVATRITLLLRLRHHLVRTHTLESTIICVTRALVIYLEIAVRSTLRQSLGSCFASLLP